MKNYLLIIIALFSNLHLFPQSIEWEKYYGGSDFDAIQAFEQTNDGGYIFGGVSSSDDGDVSLNYGNGDIWLVKTDELGIIQWEKNYGGSETENLGSIKQTSDSGYIIGGHTYSIDNDVGENYGAADSWFAKLDINGNIEWEKIFGGTEYDESRAIEIANNGDYILGGSSQSNDGDVGGNYGEYDFWVVRIDPVGNIIWKKNYGGTDSDNLYALNKTNDGGYILGANNDNATCTDCAGIINGIPTTFHLFSVT